VGVRFTQPLTQRLGKITQQNDPTGSTWPLARRNTPASAGLRKAELMTTKIMS